MRVYLTPPQPSRGLQRIADALVRYKPEWVEVVDVALEADLVVLYAIGRCKQTTALAQAIRQGGRKYAVIQVCLRSTMSPRTNDWCEIWSEADVVWSYYDLEQAVRDDYEGYNPGSDFQAHQFREHVTFYYAPLGVDAEVFYDRDMPKHYVICSSGLSRLSESVRECHLAAEQLDRFSLHLGPKMELGRRAYSKADLTDEQLANHYSACEFVSGLRRKEGFELPAAEGLLCGARPIVFDTYDYHWNYGPHAEYIQETDRQGVVDQLVDLFKRGARPVTAEERAAAAQRFNWEKIIEGFYDRLRDS